MVSTNYGKDDRIVDDGDYLTMPGVRSGGEWRPDYTMRLRVPGEGPTMQQKWDEYRTAREHHVGKAVQMEDQTQLENKAAFVHKSTAKSKRAQLLRDVRSSLDRVQEELEDKRSRLRQVIQEEDGRLIQEYVDKMRSLPRVIYEEKKRRAEEIVRRKEQQKGGEAKEKLEQLERDNSQELRERISRVKRMEAAEIQKHQICEKKIQLERESEYDRFWLELQKKRDEERLKYEEEEEKHRLTLIKNQRDLLNKQVLGKKMMQDEIKKVIEKEAALIDELRKQIREEEELEKKHKAIKKQEQMKIQQAQLAEYRRLTEERRKREKDYDDYFVHKVKEEIKKDEMMAMDTRAEQRKEAEFFMQQLNEIKAAKQQEEREIEELRMQEAQKKQEVIRRNQLQLKGARDQLNRETQEAWGQQLLYKKRMMEQERKTEDMYVRQSRDLFDLNRDLDKMKIEDRTTRDVERIKDLEWQHRYEGVMKNREIEEENNSRRNAEEEEQQKEMRMLSFGTCFGPPHPFTKAIAQNQ